MSHVLIIEDSKMIGETLKKKIESKLGLQVDWAMSYYDAVTIVSECSVPYFAAVADLNLPGAPDGEILDFLVHNQIPPIVFTGGVSEEFQQTIWDKGIVDYVLKNDADNLNYITTLLDRLNSNQMVKVLVADDDVLHREVVCRLLKYHNYIVYEAVDGREAYSVLLDNPDIKILITDNNMPQVDGFKLIKKIRKRYNKAQLAIIGMSSEDNKTLTAKFLKNGANDFLKKPFSAEEFYCRVTQNMQTIDYIETIREISHKDYLTDLYNRRYFFKTAAHLYSLAKREEKDIAVAMLDLDHFKKINDNYGHDIGDFVLKDIAKLLKARFRKSDIVARFGGEEFCVLAYGVELKSVTKLFDDVRIMVEKNEFKTEKGCFNVTASVGVSVDQWISLDEMIKDADKKLYHAKKSGRNKVVS